MKHWVEENGLVKLQNFEIFILVAQYRSFLSNIINGAYYDRKKLHHRYLTGSSSIQSCMFKVNNSHARFM